METRSFVEIILNGKDPTLLDLESVVYLLRVLRGALIGLVALEAIIGMLMVAYKYFTAYGDEAKAEKAKKQIQWIVIGTIVVILSEVLIYEVALFFANDAPVPIENAVDVLGQPPTR